MKIITLNEYSCEHNWIKNNKIVSFSRLSEPGDSSKTWEFSHFTFYICFIVFRRRHMIESEACLIGNNSFLILIISLFEKYMFAADAWCNHIPMFTRDAPRIILACVYTPSKHEVSWKLTLEPRSRFLPSCKTKGWIEMGLNAPFLQYGGLLKWVQ